MAATTMGATIISHSLAPVARPPRTALGIAEPRGFWGGAAWRQGPVDRTLPPETMRIAKRPDGCELASSLGTRRVGTRAEATELVSVMSGSRGKNATIEFEGFTLDEARAMMRSAEAKSRARLVGILEKPPEFAKVPLDFSKATLSSVTSRAVGTGSELAFSVTVPVDGQASIAIRALTAVKRASTQSLRPVADAIPGRIRKVIGQFHGQPASAAAVGSEIRRDLRDLVPDADILLKLQQEMADFTIVEIEIPVSHGTRRHPG